MDVIALSRMSRRLREIALDASQDGAELPLSASELPLVEAIAREPGITISDLSRTTGLVQSWVSTMVRRLAEKGVLEVGSDPGDRRRTRVRLAAQAADQTFATHGTRPVLAAVGRAAPHLDDTELARVEALLAELESLLARRPAAP